MEIEQKVIDRFWSKVDVDLNNNSCWEWTAYRNKDGYGILTINKKRFRANRVAYMIERGDIPEGMHVCHRCDNPPCVSPNHLFLGTRSDNMQDMLSKGRGNKTRGSEHANAKLTETDIPVIRERLANNEKDSDIAKDYGIKPRAISYIKNGRTWKHI